jgi:hypothetical protein
MRLKVEFVEDRLTRANAQVGEKMLNGSGSWSKEQGQLQT